MLRKQVDTSGKSGALLHHPAILYTPVAPQQRARRLRLRLNILTPPLKLHRLATANDRLRVANRAQPRACQEIST